MIENDLVTAYYYQRGAIQNALRYDKQMKAAVDLLNNPEKYNKLLQPTEKKKK
jgi:carboxyl-terminal processing protease